MLRKKILRKIYFTTLIVFLLFIISSFTMNKNISNIKVEYPKKLSNIYLLNDDNYLLEVKVMVNDNVMESVPIVINNLKQDNKRFQGLKGILPNNTKINKMELKDHLLYIDFNKELLNVKENLEEKVLESLIYSLLSFSDIKGLKISIDGEELKKLPQTNLLLSNILTKDFGINKEYAVNKINDMQKVTLYFYTEMNSQKYNVPVTKYVNSSDDKIKVIIDNLKNNYLSSTNLMSYLNDKISLENYDLKSNMVILSFNNILDLETMKIEEEVIYTIANSIFDSLNVERVFFIQDDQLLSIKTK